MSKKTATVSQAPVNDDVVVAEKFQLSDMLHKEDWLSIWGAFIIIAIASAAPLPLKQAHLANGGMPITDPF